MLASRFAPISLDRAIEYAPSIGATSPHSRVSGRYRHVTTSDVVGDILDSGLTIRSVARSVTRDETRRGFERVRIEFVASDYWEHVRDVGGRWATAVLIDSSDASSSLALYAGALTVVCANMATRPIGEESGFRARHSGRGLDGLTDAVRALVGGSNQTVEAMDRWDRIALSHEARRDVAEITAHVMGEALNRPVTPGMILDPPRHVRNDVQTADTLGGIYQRADVLSKVADIRIPGRPRRTRKVESIQALLRTDTVLADLFDRLERAITGA